jgi:hypothetical protein
MFNRLHGAISQKKELFRCDAMSCDRNVPTFLRNMVLPSSGQNTKPAASSEALVQFFQTTRWCHIPEDHTHKCSEFRAVTASAVLVCCNAV